MTEEEDALQRTYQQGYDPVVEAIRVLARHGRELREAPRNAVYEGMTPEKRGKAVYERFKRGELEPSEMTRLEHDSWLDEILRQRLELLEGMTSICDQYELLANAAWNCEHQAYFIDRISEELWDRLSAKEQEAFLELLQSSHWGRAEVEQAKQIIETAEWFGRLLSGQQPR